MRVRPKTIRALLIAGIAVCAIASPLADFYVMPAAARAVSLSVEFRTALEPYGAWQHHRHWGGTGPARRAAVIDPLMPHRGAHSSARPRAAPLRSRGHGSNGPLRCALGGRRGGLRSRICDRGSGATRTRVIATPGTRTRPNDFSVRWPTYRNRRTPPFLWGGSHVGCTAFSLGRFPCWMHGLEHNITATWPKSVTVSPSLRFSAQMGNRYRRMAENYCMPAKAEGAEHTRLRQLAASIAPT
jgi:hypothetical protein